MGTYFRSFPLRWHEGAEYDIVDADSKGLSSQHEGP